MSQPQCIHPTLAALLLALPAVLTAAAPAGLDANTAPQAQLEQLRGIGVALSERLLAERAVRPFSDWNDLVARIPGLGPVQARKLSAEGLRVQGRAYEEPAPR